MSTNLPAVNATATQSITPNPPAKVSWLKKFGAEVVKVVHFIAGKAAPIAQLAGGVVAAIDPVLAPEIAVAENLISKIATQASVTEAAFTAVGQASNGPGKLQAVLNAIGPEVDAWVTNAFPGAIKLSTTAKAGLVNSVVAILNEIDGNLALAAPTASSVAAASAAQAAVAAAK